MMKQTVSPFKMFSAKLFEAEISSTSLAPRHRHGQTRITKLRQMSIHMGWRL